MKTVEFWKWRYTDPETGAPRVTSYRMTVEEAQQRFPDAQAVEGTCEIRDLPESPDEWQTAGKPKR